MRTKGPNGGQPIRMRQRATLKSQQQTKMAMAGKVEWTPELVETLIESVRSKNVVWDTSSTSYKNKNAQESAWMQIASDCGLEGKALCAKAKRRHIILVRAAKSTTYLLFRAIQDKSISLAD